MEDLPRDARDALQIAAPDQGQPSWLSEVARKFDEMPIERPVEITTERFLLREVNLADWARIKAVNADSEHRQYVLPQQLGDKHVDKVVAIALVTARAKHRLSYCLAIQSLESGDFLGTCILQIPHLNSRRGFIGFEIGRQASGKGVATEVGRAMVDLAFLDDGVEEVFGDMHEGNLACRRAFAKIGFSPVALSRWSKFKMRFRYWANIPYARMSMSRAQWDVLRLRQVTQSSACGQQPATDP